MQMNSQDCSVTPGRNFSSSIFTLLSLLCVSMSKLEILCNQITSCVFRLLMERKLCRFCIYTAPLSLAWETRWRKAFLSIFAKSINKHLVNFSRNFYIAKTFLWFLSSSCFYTHPNCPVPLLCVWMNPKRSIEKLWKFSHQKNVKRKIDKPREKNCAVVVFRFGSEKRFSHMRASKKIVEKPYKIRIGMKFVQADEK